MSLLRQIWQDLRTKRLWPVAAALLLAIVAVPVVLSSSSGAPAVTPPPAAPAPVANGLPAVSETAVPASSAPTGSAHNPFAPAGGGAATSPTTSTTTLPGTTTAPTGSSTPGPAAGPTSGGTPTGPTTPSGGPTPPTPPPIPTPKPKPAIPALDPDQTYSVALAITKPTGGLNTLAPLQRLAPLPSSQQPLVVELGVLRGGSRVLFAVQPGTVVSGKGVCIPGPIDCEILSLAQGQTERLSVQTSHGPVRVAMFAVTRIIAAKHSSRSAAMKVRHQESKAGRRVLEHSSLKALKLFRYEPSTGAVIDLRNLTLRNS
jgi:hypothetical protein